ncbi:MAG: hypothetical protein U9N82_03605 [Thermodesulfobacteriota bacterium]|nr:hypothetical protein [Thermodesulfobacteriota bacterium]
MTKLSEGRLKNVFNLLEDMKVFTLERLVSSLSCSVPTARLKLKQWGAYTSYNQNGRYYAMSTVPRFDNNGLWNYEDIYFSRYGNLKNTIVHLVEKSPSGLTGKEIGVLVRLDPRSFLHHFRNVGGIQREKPEGVYVYFSDNPVTYKHQRKSRSKLTHPVGEFFSEGDAVVILSAMIKHHGICLEDIIALPEIRMHKISPAAIHDFMERHGLVKKTPATKP